MITHSLYGNPRAVIANLAKSKAKQSNNNFLVRRAFNLAYQPIGSVILNLFQDLCGAFKEMLKQVQHDSGGTDRQNILIRNPTVSSPRRRGSIPTILNQSTFLWIPAFAGMTPESNS